MWMFFLSLGLAAQSAAPTCRTADVRVEALISSKAKELGASEYCQFRLYHTLDDVDGDRQPDFIVVFGLEGLRGGGNAASQFLAVFSSRADWKPASVQVGSRTRQVTAIAVDPDGTIVLTTLEHRATDPMCCPSGHGEARYGLHGDRLVAVKSGRSS